MQGMMAGFPASYFCIKAFSETDTTEDLKKFDIPTLILHGDDDQIVPIQSAALLSSKIEHHDGRVVAIGHSAGGHLVLWLAAARPTPSLAGVLALAPVADLRLAQAMNLGDGAVPAFLGIDSALRSDVDPRRLPSPAVPVTIVHGDRDDTVPIEISDSYVGAHHRARLVRAGGCGHYGWIDPSSPVWPTVIEELDRLSCRS